MALDLRDLVTGGSVAATLTVGGAFLKLAFSQGGFHQRVKAVERKVGLDNGTPSEFVTLDTFRPVAAMVERHDESIGEQANHIAGLQAITQRSDNYRG